MVDGIESMLKTSAMRKTLLGGSSNVFKRAFWASIVALSKL